MSARHALVALLLVLPLACSKSPEERLSLHKAKARAYMQEQKLDEAVLELRSALALSPDDPDALFLLGKALWEKGEAREAYQAFRKVEEVAPDRLDAPVYVGNLLLMAGSPEKARERAERVLAADPERPDAHLLMAGVLMAEGRTDEAVKHYDRAIDLDPGNPENRMVKAAALLRAGRLAEARRTLDALLERSPDHAGGLILMAEVLEAQGDREAVEQVYRRLQERRPDDPQVWMAYGRIWLRRGDRERALDAFRKAGEVDPKGTEGWEKVAEIALGQGDLDTAREAVGKIFEKNPGSTAGKRLEGRILVLEKRYDEAVGRLQEVLKQYPNDAVTHYFLGMAYRGMGNLKLAKQSLSKASELNPAFYDPKVLLARVLLDERDFQGALDATRDLMVGRQMLGEAVLIRAEALMGLGRPKDARGLLERLVKADPRNARAYERLGVCYLAEGKTGRALGSFKKALELAPSWPRPLARAVQVLVADGRADDAVALVEGHIERAGDSAQARELLGMLWKLKGDRGKARQELQKAIELDANAAAAYVELAELHPWPQGVRDAIKDLDRALEKDPKSLRAWMMKGLLHQQLGEMKMAEAAYRRCLELSPDFAPALNELAWVLVETGGNIDEALKFAEGAVEQAPDSPLYNDTLGWIYVKKGVFLKAASHLEPAAETLARQPKVWYHLAKAYEGAGEREKAVAALEKALALSDGFAGAEDARKTLEALKGGE